MQGRSAIGHCQGMFNPQKLGEFLLELLYLGALGNPPGLQNLGDRLNFFRTELQISQGHLPGGQSNLS
jgi:hypothetical protein